MGTPALGIYAGREEGIKVYFLLPHKSMKSLTGLSDPPMHSGAVTLDESFGPGETIFSPGDLAETLMYIRRGRVKLSVASRTGKEAILAILGPR